MTIQGLQSRSDLNGMKAVIKADRGDRYLVAITKDTGDVEMLRVKKTNVVTASSSKLEEMLRKYMGAEHVAQWKAIVTEMRGRFRREIQKISPNISETQGVAGICLLLLAFVFFVGFMRTMILVGILLYLILGCQVPTVVSTYRAQGVGVTLKAVAQVVGKDFATRTIAKVYPGRANWKNGLMVLCALMFIVIRMTASSSSSSGMMTTTTTTSQNALQEAYDQGYRNGWADATDDSADFGAHRTYTPTYSDDYTSSSSLPSSSSSFGIGKMITGGMLAYNAWKLGQTGTGRWDPQVAMTQFQLLPTIRKALLGFLVLRLVGLSPI